MTQTEMEQFKPLVSENFEFEYLVVSNCKAFYAVFAKSFRRKEKMNFLPLNIYLKIRSSQLNLDEKSEVSSLRKS